MRMRRLAILLALLVPASASASDGALLAAQGALSARGAGRVREHARRRAGPLRRGTQPRRGGAGRGPVSPARRALRADLLARGRAQVARAEALDRADGFRSAAPLAPLPGVGPGLRPTAPGRRRSPAASPPSPRRANGAVGVWVHELGSGRYAGFQAGHALRGGLDRQARRARRRAARLAAAGAQPLVVRRAPDRLLVVEPRREQDRRPASATPRSETGCAGSG